MIQPLSSPTHESLILEDVELNNVPVAVQDQVEMSISQEAQRQWLHTVKGTATRQMDPTNIQDPIPPFHKPGSLLSGEKSFQTSIRSHIRIDALL